MVHAAKKWAEEQKLANNIILRRDDEKKGTFWVAKQMMKTNQDLTTNLPEINPVQGPTIRKEKMVTEAVNKMNSKAAVPAVKTCML